MYKDKEAKEIFYDFEENFYKNNFEQDNGALFLDRDGVIIKDVNYIVILMMFNLKQEF